MVTMANARQLYMQAESKGRVLSGRLQQRLQDSTAHDEHWANVEIQYRLVHSRESPELGEQLQNALSYEDIALGRRLELSHGIQQRIP